MPPLATLTLRHSSYKNLCAAAALLFACGGGSAGNLANDGASPSGDMTWPDYDFVLPQSDLTQFAQPDLATSPDLTSGCTGLPLCDDFESDTAGAAPDAQRWTIVSPSCSGTGMIAVDDTQSHSGKNSVKVTGQGGYCNHVFLSNSAAISSIDVNGAAVYARFYLRLQSALGSDHVTFLTMQDTADGGKDLRMGGQSQILMWNRESDDATLPALSPNGIALSIMPATNTWMCVEFMVNGAAGTMQTWVDGTEVAALHEDGVPTQDIDQQWLTRANWHPQLDTFRLGWESYGNTAMTLWVDDVALAGSRIGCN